MGVKAKLRKKVKRPSTDDITEKCRVILKKEIAKRGDQREPFVKFAGRNNLESTNMAGAAQLPWPIITQASECRVRSTATLDSDSTRAGMVQSTRLLPQTFLD